VNVTVADNEVDAPVEFDGWVKVRAPSLLRFAYLMTGNHQAAEDALQTALAKTYEHWSRVSVMHDRDAYVRRLIVNAHISWWRRFARRESPVGEIRGSSVLADDPGVSVPGADAVWRLCQSLPPKQRAAVVLRFYEDLTYPEIAELLHCPESTVRSHVYRALAALRALIKSQEAHDA